MPSGPPELHRKWKSDGNAVSFLEKKGWTLTPTFSWIPPEEYDETDCWDECREAIAYCILEWDYGGILTNLQEAYGIITLQGNAIKRYKASMENWSMVRCTKCQHWNNPAYCCLNCGHDSSV